ncbi:MAG: hypothetical protein K1X72_09445 [Pyrinomonadaceae bacterium]|nr:hypothetical protein [Pyrinomonadaceae bacterium]
MQIFTFMFTFLLIQSKFERQGGLVGICLTFGIVGFIVLTILGWAILMSIIKKK